MRVLSRPLETGRDRPGPAETFETLGTGRGSGETGRAADDGSTAVQLYEEKLGHDMRA